MTSSEVCEITKAPRQIIYSTVFENVEPKSEGPTWVRLPNENSLVAARDLL